MAFDRKLKFSDNWKPDSYVILEQPIQDVPVYVVRREAGDRTIRTLHRYLLLPQVNCHLTLQNCRFEFDFVINYAHFMDLERTMIKYDMFSASVVT